MFSIFQNRKEKKVISSIISKKYKLEESNKAIDLLYKSRSRDIAEALYLIEIDQLNMICDISLIKEQKGINLNLNKKDLKFLYKKISASNSLKFILSHNHPSQNCNPSIQDLIATVILKKNIKNINKELVDHVIWTKNKMYSYTLNKVIS